MESYNFGLSCKNYMYVVFTMQHYFCRKEYIRGFYLVYQRIPGDVSNKTIFLACFFSPYNSFTVLNILLISCDQDFLIHRQDFILKQDTLD